MATVTGRLEQEFPGTNRNVTVQFLKDKAVGTVRPALVVLMVAVAFVLLIACANVAHMLHGARRGTTARDCGAVGTGRTAFANHVAVSDRERAAGACRRALRDWHWRTGECA